jgi:hypothetical protein
MAANPLGRLAVHPHWQVLVIPLLGIAAAGPHIFCRTRVFKWLADTAPLGLGLVSTRLRSHIQ